MEAEPQVFLNGCLTGMVFTKDNNSSIPITPQEIIEQSLLLSAMGVGILHLHARDEEGKPTWRKDIYQRIIGGIREKNEEVIICVTTSGRLWSDFDRRSEVLSLEGDYKPDMASLTLGSLNFKNSASINEPSMIVDLCQKMLDSEIKPELEIFDTGMLNQMHILIKNKLLQPPYYVNLMFGGIYTMQLTLNQVSFLLANLPSQTLVGFAGLGQFQLPATHLAVALGKGVRIGLEDNLYLDNKNKTIATNEQLVASILKVIEAMAKTIIPSSEIRKILNLSVPAKVLV